MSPMVYYRNRMLPWVHSCQNAKAKSTFICSSNWRKERCSCLRVQARYAVWWIDRCQWSDVHLRAPHPDGSPQSELRWAAPQHSSVHTNSFVAWRGAEQDERPAASPPARGAAAAVDKRATRVKRAQSRQEDRPRTIRPRPLHVTDKVWLRPCSGTTPGSGT
jgi:hypothetical protein